MQKITSSVKTGGALVFLLVFFLTFLVASTENTAGLNVTTDDISKVTCYNAGDGSIEISITGGDGNYTYSWTGPGAYTSSNEDITGLGAGTYSLTVTDDSGNSGSTTIEITQPNLLELSGSVKTNVTCFGANNGTLKAGTVTGGNSGFEYSIGNNTWQTSNEFTNMFPGTYKIKVRDNEGCEAESVALTITQPTELVINNTDYSKPTCKGNKDASIISIDVSGGTSNYQYKVDDAPYQNGKNFNGLGAGNHTIYVKDANGCIATKTIEIIEPEALTLTGSTTEITSCNGVSDGVIISGAGNGGSPPYEYKVNGRSYQSGQTFTGFSTGSYTITVKDASGCTASESVTVTEPAVLQIQNSTFTEPDCFGTATGTATAGSISGGTSPYEYTIDSGSYSSTNSFSNLSAGSHVITVKDANGCEATETINITQPEQLTLSNSTPTPVSCNGGMDGEITAGVVAGGNSGFQYSVDGGTFSSSNSFSGLSAGNHVITVKDNKGCEATETVFIPEPDVLSITASSTTPVSCNNGSDGTATAGTVTGGNTSFEYSIDGGAFSSLNTFSGLSAGDHTITVKDNKGCEASEIVTVIEPDILTLNGATTTPVSCNGGADGTATAGTVAGGNTNFEYNIDGGAFSTSKSFSGLIAGNHTITVRDNKGCEATETITITEPVPLISTDPTFTVVSCNGGADGTITAGTPSGGNGTYTYSLNDGSFASSNTFNNLSAGSYTLRIKDAKDCEITPQLIEVTEPDALSMTEPSSTSVSCFGGTDGTITVGTMSGGNGNYQYSLDNTTFTTSTSFDGLAAGNYTIFVKDSKDCALQKTISIGEPNILSASFSKTNVSCFDGSNGTITVSQATGGNGTYEYSIDGSNWQSATLFDNLSHGTYSLYIRDAANTDCEITVASAIEITQPAAPISAEIVTTRTTTYATATGTATANAIGGTPGYTYAWRTEGSTTVLQTTKTANNLVAGNYEVTITDTKGCSYTTTLVIIETIDAQIIPTSICSDIEEEIIRTSYFEVEDLTALGGVGPYTYNWNFGENATPATATGPGSHEVKYSTTGNKNITVTVTDSENVSKEFTYVQFVGECYRDNCGSNDFIGSGYYVGDADGNPATIANCNDGSIKYIHMNISNNSERYSLYAEITYTIINILTGESNTVTQSGCFYENEIVPTEVRTIQVPWECGSVITVDRIYLTFSNNIKWECGQGPNPKCFSTNNSETVISPLYATAQPNELLCHDDEFGTIDVSASGGKAPYTYSITSATSGFQDSPNFTNLAAGNYDVWVKDFDGLIYQVPTITITQPANPISLETVVEDPICFGEFGAATVTATGGTPFETGDSYQYLWNDASEQTTATATNLVAGQYTITVIDANGCQAIQSVTVTEPEELTIAETGEDQVYGCGFNTTNLEANTPETGTGIWSLDTDNSDTGGSITTPTNPNSEFTGPAGTYTLVWTIAHEDGTCSSSSAMVVTFAAECSTLDFDGVDDHVVLGDNYPFTSGSFSIEVWVKPNSVSGIKTVLSKRDYSNMNSGGFDLIINNGAPTFRWGSNSVSTSSKVTADRWYHLAVIYQNSNLQLFVDGIRVGNSAATNPGGTAAEFLLGAVYDSSNPEIPQNYYHGWMEELRIWDTALTTNQLRFMMNQRVVNNGGKTKGEVLPLDVPNALSWNNLKGYYRLMADEIANGETPDIANNSTNGILKNIETLQENTAPLPYISNQDGSWRSTSTWLRPSVWDVPNGIGINGDNINWNIARISNDIYSGSQDIYMLGLLSESKELMVDGNVTSETGQGLTVTHYLKLDGTINLEGSSQLVQTEGSILDEASSGYVDVDQQGTANSFNYNYWTSPVSLTGSSNNSGYKIATVLLDATTPASPQNISFNYQYHWADGNYSGAKRISSYWLYTFQGTADDYFQWGQVEATELLSPGIGYSMKGTTGYVPINNKQNYTFRGKPNNGDISVAVGVNQNLLTGNPYPSAINAQEFIQDNLGNFNGSIYFWDHFGPVNSHFLEEYIGGYAVYNLSGGVASATSRDARIDATGESSDKSPPGQYIPVGQAFFINTIGVSNPSSITYKNKYRAFVPESSSASQFHSQEDLDPKKGQDIDGYKKDTRYKIRVKFESPKGYHRQILVAADARSTNGFDLGYDAPLIENNMEDMYWIVGETEFVIQAVPNFNLDQVLKLGIKIAEPGEFTIKIDELENIKSSFDIYLRDLKTDEYFKISNEPYKAVAEEIGNFNDRYEIVFRKEKIGKPISEKPEIELDDTNLALDYYREADAISLLNPELRSVDFVELYSVSGQKIKTFKEVPTNESVLLSIDQKLSSAVYIVKVYSGDKIYSKKVIINR